MTRQNDRRLRLPDGDWVRNRDRWVVTGTSDDGAMTVRQAGRIGEAVLPADYVAEHVELGYASTAYGAQGVTADTAHAFVSTAMSREVLYVAVTRGRQENRLHVDVCPEPAQPEMAHGAADYLDVRDVLLAVVDQRGGELSARQAIRNEWSNASSFERLAQEHQTLVAAAAAGRWEAVLETCGLDSDVLVKARCSVEWAGLLGALRDADNRGLKPEDAIPMLVTSRPIDSEKDPAGVLRARLYRWEQSVGGAWRGGPSMVAGIVPRAEGITDPDLTRAIRGREAAIAERARALAEEALDRDAEWARPLGPPPEDPGLHAAFVARVAVVAAYRERWDIRTHNILGGEAGIGSAQQLAHRNRARRAGQEAARLAAAATERTPAPDPSPPAGIEVGLTI